MKFSQSEQQQLLQVVQSVYDAHIALTGAVDMLVNAISLPPETKAKIQKQLVHARLAIPGLNMRVAVPDL